MPKRKPRFQWPPPGDESRQFHAEIAAPAVILRELGADIAIGPSATKDEDGKPIRPKWASIDDWLKSTDGGMSGLTKGGGHSWNHPQLLMAARGLALDDWGDAGRLMAMQAGRIPGEGMAALLDGEEPRSTDYDPYRWAAGLVFASRGPKEFKADATAVLKRQVGLAMLGAVSWSDAEEFVATNGRRWYEGPTLSPVGERSPKTSNPDLLEIFCRATFGAQRVRPERIGFAGEIARLFSLGDTLAISKSHEPFAPETAVALLGDAKVYGTFHFVEYPEGRLVWRPEQLNPNTPTCLWSFADHATKRQTRGWPFPEGKQRGQGAAKSMGCAIEGNVVISRAVSPGGERFESMYPLPKAKPLWSVIVDGQGARFE